MPGRTDITRDEDLELRLQDTRALMREALSSTPIHSVVSEYDGLMGNGKMLRSRLAFRVGPASGIPVKTLTHAAAAVELIHSASLLHDDVIDGGYLRRGAPAFWVERGIPGAILLGDLMLFKALSLLAEVGDTRLVPEVVQLTGEVCEAESEQELVLRGRPSDWETCVHIARRKTGALFAFIGFTCGGHDDALCVALRNAGYAVGTAYQLADDILDVNGDPESAGKTLGSDRAREKLTAVSAASGPVDRVAYVEELCESARSHLDAWPAIQAAWDDYVALDMRPALSTSLGLVRT
jgi:geranylgeranyl pyrophosphate synthase